MGDTPLTDAELTAWLETLAANDQSLEARLRDPELDLRVNADGSGDCGPVNGVVGTFTEGMSFIYSGSNNYMDQLSAGSGAASFRTICRVGRTTKRGAASAEDASGFPGGAAMSRQPAPTMSPLPLQRRSSCWRSSRRP